MIHTVTMAAEPRHGDRYQQACQLQSVYAFGQRNIQQDFQYQPQKSEQYLYQNNLPIEIAPVAPPTPPAEDAFKPQMLPSISSLLDIAPDRQSSSFAFEQHQGSRTQQQYPLNAAEQLPSPPLQDESDMAIHSSMDYAQTSAHYPRGSFAGPATPPLVHDSMHSPSAMSVASTMSMPQSYYLSPMAGHPEHQGRSFSEPNIMKPHSLTMQQHYPAGFASAGHRLSASHYYSSSPVTQSSGMLTQKPLPTNFPPMFTPSFGGSSALGLNISAASSPWQHHHYIGPASQSSYTQSQDRYICPTCSKAFSRPSSLRIHSHSHTGEKPYKCSFVGCGKAFSVRSNMKRHERGCHGDRYACAA